MERWTLKQLPICSLTVSSLLTFHPQYVQAQLADTQTGNGNSAGSSFTGSKPRYSTAADPTARARIAVQAAREEEISSMLSEGVELYRKKQNAEALSRFAQVIRLDPHNASAHFNLGIVKEAMGNYVEALGNYSQAAHDEPDNQEYASAVQAIAARAQKQKQLASQRSQFKQLTANANAAWRRGEYMSALDLYLQLDAQEPNKALVKYNIGSIYMMLKDQPNALSFYKEAHNLDPGEPKYARAYEELSAVVKKETRGQEKAQQQARREYQAAQRHSVTPQAVAPTPTQTQDGSISPYNSIGTTPVNSPFASMMVPTQAPAQQRKHRSHYGLSPDQSLQFQSTVPSFATQNQMKSFGITGSDNGQGVTVTSVSSRAAAGGLRRGDDIRAVDGSQISSQSEINAALHKANASSKVKFLILRNGNLAVLEL